VEERYVIKNAYNFKDDIMLRDCVFLFSRWGHLITWTVFSRSATES